MLYLLDANVLIDANRDYYPIGSVPEFWEWLVSKGESGEVKIPVEMYEELTSGNDTLAIWAKQREIRNALLLQEEADVVLVQRVIDDGYASDLTDAELGKLGRDPLLISYGLRDTKERCVVTTEVSAPSKERANRRVPDVCGTFGVTWIHAYEFYRRLGFKTNWRAP